MAPASANAASAANRFGLGARPGELAVLDDPRGWLHAQVARGAVRIEGELPDSRALLRLEADTRRAARAARRDDATAGGNGAPGGRQTLRRWLLADVAARARLAATTDRPFVERMVRFWSNHFAVSVDKAVARPYAAPLEREAIRPHATGDFADLLVAVASHPAMLRYLDNAASIGADSPAARRRARNAPGRPGGLNENLARELLELHTLGVGGGYTQADVTELARALTGWAVAPDAGADATRPGFVFRAGAHEPGARTVLGRRYAEDGEGQARAILRDLARHPATARHLATKVARHVVSDTPPPALVARLARAYGEGDLRALYAALVDADEAWAPGARRFKTPDDFVVSAMRAGGFTLDARPDEGLRLLRDLGQPVFEPRSPAGYPDGDADWIAGDALRRRLQVAGTLADRVTGAATPLALATDVLGPAIDGGALATALRRAGSPRDGYALLFASPDFQWRT